MQYTTIEEAFENENASPDFAIRQLAQARKVATELRKAANEAEKAMLDAELEAKRLLDKVRKEMEEKKTAADLADTQLAKLDKQGPTRFDVWLQERIGFTMMNTASCRGTRLI